MRLGWEVWWADSGSGVCIPGRDVPARVPGPEEEAERKWRSSWPTGGEKGAVSEAGQSLTVQDCC